MKSVNNNDLQLSLIQGDALAENSSTDIMEEGSSSSSSSSNVNEEKTRSSSYIDSLAPEYRNVVRKGKSVLHTISLSVVIVAFVVALVIPSKPAKGGLCLFIMAVIWVTELLPLPTSSLLPIFLFSFTNIMHAKAISKVFWNANSFLFSTGFLMGGAVQRWDLHKRLAVNIVLTTGTNVVVLLFMIMFAAWVMSMWINNSAAILCLLPVVKRFLSSIPVRHAAFKKGTLLAMAYASSIGGMATIVGSLTNGVAMGVFENNFGTEFGFGEFLVIALPFSTIMLIVAWLFTCIRHIWFSSSGTIEVNLDEFRKMRRELGPMKREEKIVCVYLFVLILVWCFARPIKAALGLLFIETASIGMIFTFPLFFIPATTRKLEKIEGEVVIAENILDWKYVKTVFRWEILLIFGSGYMVAAGTTKSGFVAWAAQQIGVMPELQLVVIVAFLICFMTEVISNMACINIFAPLVMQIAATMGYDPMKFLFICSISASFAFMLPMACGPNMIVYGTGKDFSLRFMIKNGLYLNLIAVFVGIVYMNYIMPSLLPTGYTYAPTTV
eukprot:g6809.t1